MNQSFSTPASPRQLNNNRQFSPKRQQWALINQYKALEYERLKQKQRLLALQKKNTFRRQLDNQLHNKNNAQIQEIQADRRYYEFITQQANQMKEREERQKIQRIIKRRQAQEQNAKLLQMTRNSRMRDHDTGYHLQIGQKSQQQRKRNSENIKKTVLDTLDEQIRKKNEQRERNLMMQRQKQLKNLHYQYEYFDKRGDSHKKFGQNERVYQYYQELERQKRMKQMELQSKLVDQAAFRKQLMEDQRIRNEQMRRNRIKSQVKETLDQQVQAYNYRKFQESKINPQQYSYGVIGSVFKQRQSSYDKSKYMQELKMQAEQQKMRKKMENYMSEEEYRFNLNQLNKVVNGQYAHNGYIDRSLGTIGDNKLLKLADIKDRIGDRDADLIKQRLDSLRRSQNNSQILSRTDRSF